MSLRFYSCLKTQFNSTQLANLPVGLSWVGSSCVALSFLDMNRTYAQHMFRNCPVELKIYSLSTSIQLFPNYTGILLGRKRTMDACSQEKIEAEGSFNNCSYR